MFAAAQHKNLYIYDGSGTELHCLRNHKPQVNRLGYLRYHWLLTSISSSGHLRYLDVSTGANVADIHTRLGDCDCMRTNPWNALVHLGHKNGVVTMWTPNMPEPAVKMLTHKGSVAAIAIDRSGRYMATSGRDGALKLWDVRTYRPLHEYHTPRPATSLDISDRGLLAAVHGPSVQVFKDCLSKRANGPYMTHLLPGCEADSALFVPYEDFLGIGHSKGFCSMLVPGAGEPNFDSYEANPYEKSKQRQEGEVVALLEKLPSDTIMLDPSRINTVDRSQTERQKEMKHARDARLAEISANKRAKKKTRGRSKAARKAAKKQGNIMDEKRQLRQQELEERRKRVRQRAGPSQEEDEGYNPLGRFGKRE
jgi:U3 small nucleolar RNA-associated protein 7